jgi:hypothetical protein
MTPLVTVALILLLGPNKAYPNARTGSPSVGSLEDDGEVADIPELDAPRLEAPQMGRTVRPLGGLSSFTMATSR